MEKLDYQPVGMPSDSKSIDVGQTQNLNSNILVHFNEKHLLVKNGKRLLTTFGYQPVSMTLA